MLPFFTSTLYPSKNNDVDIVFQTVASPKHKSEFDDTGIKSVSTWPRRYSRGTDLAQASVGFNYMKLIVIQS